MDVPIAANVLGTIGAVCWSVQLVPQIVVNYRRHDTTGLQPTMMLLWASAGIPLGVYNIAQSFNIALRIQPQILTFLSLVTWTQCKYYGLETKWSLQKCMVAVVPLGLVMAGIEVGLVFALQHAVSRRLEWPSDLMAILSAVLLSAGVLRHYWDIYRERTVRGISFLFVGIDAMGDLTSLISLLFQRNLDILGMVIYGSELILWLGVFACGGWFNFRPWVKNYQARRKENQSQVTSDNARGNTTETVQDRDSVEMDGPVSPASSTVFRTASNESLENEIRQRHTTRV